VSTARRRLLPLLVGCALLAGSPALWSMPVSLTDGLASYYGGGFNGRRTASGQRFDQHAMTAAHRTLSFGTKVRVTNARNGRSVVVTINDRGPFVRGRIIDLSRGAARAIGMLGAGVAPVRLEVVGQDIDGGARSSLWQRGSRLLMELF
jgi:rare lipoprotein A